MVFLMIDFKRFVSGSWPLTTGETSAPLLGGGHDAALSRGCALLPPPVAWTGAVAGAPSASKAECSVGTVIVCRKHNAKLRHDLDNAKLCHDLDKLK